MARALGPGLGLAVALLVLSGCGSTEKGETRRVVGQPAGGSTATPSRQSPAASESRQRWDAHCPSPGKVLRGVYHPERLSVIDPCRRVVGRVALIRDYEEDGDLHFDVAVRDKSLLAPNNYREQDGLLVVEMMPRDNGHLPVPGVGDRVTLVGAWVDDTAHRWNEIHPVFGIRIGGGAWHTSGPRFGGSPPYTRSDNSLALCRTASGARCMGYNGVVAPPPENHEPASTAPPGAAPGKQGKSCDPSYPTVCIPPPPPDLDCGEIPYRDFKVVGADPHHFDGDGNGIGCE